MPPPADARRPHGRGPVVCCPDKFRGSLSASEAAEALAAGVERTGRAAVRLPLADGGEGTLDVLCPSAGDRRTARVTVPLGEPVDAEWGMRGDTAVVEMARASGLSLVTGESDPLRATTRGTGELIRAAVGRTRSEREARAPRTMPGAPGTGPDRVELDRLALAARWGVGGGALLGRGRDTARLTARRSCRRRSGAVKESPRQPRAGRIRCG
jgi:hypothetical protein